MNSAQHTRRKRRNAARAARAVTLLATAFTSATGLAQPSAQKTASLSVNAASSIALPLVSVGKDVGWKIPPEDYRVFVPQGAAERLTRLDLYSPEINRNDYANKRNATAYYGDELYGKNAQVKTTFKLLGALDAELANQTFASGTQHSTATLLAQQLNAGYYPLQVSSLGNGKNSFQIRASSGVRVEASQFVVNARGQYNRDQLVAFLDLGQSALGKTVRLENYDADGLKEMGLTLVDPKGKRRELKVSGDTAWAADDVRVTPENVGTWKILTRVLPTTKQFSNSVVFRFKLDGQPLFSRIPGFGTPLPAQPAPAQPVPAQPTPVQPPEPLAPPAPEQPAPPALEPPAAPVVQPAPPAPQPAPPAPIIEPTPPAPQPAPPAPPAPQPAPPAPVAVEPTPPAPVVVEPAPPPPAPILNGVLRVNATALVCGATSSIISGFSIDGQRYATNSNVSLAPGEYTVQPEVQPGSSAQAVKVTVKSDETTSANIEYRVNLSLNLEPKAVNLTLGERTSLTATVSTAFPFAVPASISLSLPDGLFSDAPLKLSGQVSSQNALSLMVPVRAMKTVQDGAVRVALEPSCGVTQTININATPRALPNERRESQLIVLAKLADVPTSGFVILSDRLPAGALYTPGSSRAINGAKFDANQLTATMGETISDPLVAGDRLYWVLPLSGVTTYAVTYRVGHDSAITVPSNPSVILVLPQSRSLGKPNQGQQIDPASVIGKLVGQGQVRLVQGETEALENLSKAAPIGSNSTVLTRAVGGAATTIKLRGEHLTTDSAGQASIVVEALDKDGNPASDTFVTLELNVEPATPDAASELTGYQVKLENGVGRVRLVNLGGNLGDNNPIPTVIAQARITNANGTVSSSTQFKVSELSINASDNLQPTALPVGAAPRPWVGIGAAGVQFNYTPSATSAFSVSGSLEAFARGQVFGDWLLTAATSWRANYDGAFNLSGSLLPPANPYERFPLLGDASQIGSDAHSSEGFYLRLEKGQSYLLYGQMAPGFKGLLTNYSQNFNGFQGVLRGDSYSLNTFAAFVPNANQRFSARGDGTGRYRLPTAVEPSSERLVVVTYDKDNSSLKRSEVVLTRGADYAIDYLSGNIQLARVLFENDANGNPQFLEVQYAAEASAAQRELRFGVQASLNASDLTFQTTGLVYRIGGGPNGENLGLVGAGASYKNGGFQFGVEGTYSGPFGSGGGLGLAAQLNYNNAALQAQARYQELWLGYVDPNTGLGASGRALQAGATYKLTNTFSLTSNLAHNQSFTTGAADDAVSLEARNDFGFLTAAIGGYGKWNFGPTRTTDIYATAGLEVPLGAFRFGALERVPLTAGTYGDTTLSLDYAISANFGIRLADKLTYEPGQVRQNLSFGVRGLFTNNQLLRSVLGNTDDIPDTFGTTNIAASYELDNLSGNAGRTRVNIDTTIPLGLNFSARLGGEANVVPGGSSTGSANLGVVYSASGLKAGAQAQVSFQPNGIKQVYSANVIGQLSDNITLSPSLEYAIDPSFTTLPNGASVRDGGRFSVAAAWRADDWTALTNNTGRFGLYAPNGDELRGEVQFGYQGFERLALRGGVSYLYTSSTLTMQLSAGGTYFFSDDFGAGVQAAYLFQPATGVSKLAFGIEGSVRLLDGFLVSVGTNLIGFNNGLSFSTAPGFYVRFDWKFDERTFGGGR